MALVLAGPTASGKSALALDVARRLGGVVINADSMQIYRDLDILTARPDAAALQTVPHRLYGVLDGADPCSAARWREMALAEIRAARQAGLLPILCGGTGLYLEALTAGLTPVPDIPAAVRQAVREELAQSGAAALHARLQQEDPPMAARLHPADSQRIARALEVVRATGRSLLDWRAAGEKHADGAACGEMAGGGEQSPRFLTAALLPPRQEVYARCDARFTAMLEKGALAEVAALLARGLSPDLPVMRALGVRELAACLRGVQGLDQAAAQARTATRRYAKRQMTWIRNRMPAAAVLPEDAPFPALLERLRTSGLTP